MASANPLESSCVSIMLKYIKTLENLLIDAIKQFVSRITARGEAWTEGKDTKSKYTEINEIIDSAINFLREKSLEIAGVESYPTIAQATSANLWESTFVSFKLKYLKEQGDLLIADVRQYVNGIIDEGKLWTKGKDKRNYKTINTMIENAIKILRQKAQEIAGNQLSQPSCEQPDLSSQSIGATASTSATPDTKPLAQRASTSAIPNNRTPPKAPTSTTNRKRPPPQASTSTTPAKRQTREVSTATTSHRHSTESVQPADATLLNAILARTGALEEEMRNFRSETEALLQVIQEVAAMSPRLQQLEQISRVRCGFSAESRFSGRAPEDIPRHYSILYSNAGENFDAQSGVFRAPVDGLYVASISLWVKGDRGLRVDVMCMRGAPNNSESLVCQCSVSTAYTTACSVGVVGLTAGDTLFARVFRMYRYDSDKIVTFSCFLLG